MVAANPLPADGVVGRLTREQSHKLRQFWSHLLTLVDNAPKQGYSDASASPSHSNNHSHDAPPPPKDDAAKEKHRADEEMKNARLALEQYGSDRFLATFWRFIAMDHPDALALKFLRARKWNPSAGVAMMAACIKWRIESGVEDICSEGEEGMQSRQGFLFQMTSGKGYLYGTDRHGRPVIYINVKLHKAADQPQKALEDFILLQMESLRCLAHGSVDKVSMVFNMDGFGMANMDWKCIMFIVKCLESYYPESLNVILIHRAPFSTGVWKILAPMLDPVVRAKVQMTKSTEDLCIHIDKTHLSHDLGGSNCWSWEYPPVVPGENSIMQDKATAQRLQDERDDLCKQFERHTRKWAVGDSEDLEGERTRLAKRLRAQYFALDPYIRARGAYHRVGNIIGNGLICFRYPGIDGSEEGIYEVIGHEGSKETLEAELGIGGSSEQMTDTLKSNSINKHAGHDDDAFSENDSQATHRNGAMTMPSTPITFPRTPTSTGKSDTLSPASAGRLPAMSRTGSIASSLHSSADASNGDIDGSPSSSSSTTKRLRKRISSSPALKLRTSLFRPSTKNKG